MPHVRARKAAHVFEGSVAVHTCLRCAPPTQRHSRLFHLSQEGIEFLARALAEGLGGPKRATPGLTLGSELGPKKGGHFLTPKVGPLVLFYNRSDPIFGTQKWPHFLVPLLFKNWAQELILGPRKFHPNPPLEVLCRAATNLFGEIFALLVSSSFVRVSVFFLLVALPTLPFVFSFPTSSSTLVLFCCRFRCLVCFALPVASACCC